MLAIAHVLVHYLDLKLDNPVGERSNPLLSTWCISMQRGVVCFARYMSFGGLRMSTAVTMAVLSGLA